MLKYARIQNGVVIETITTDDDIEKLFPAALNYQPCSDETEQLWIVVDDEYLPPSTEVNFYVSPTGQRSIEQQPDWQQLNAPFDCRMERDGDQWIVVTDAMRLASAKAKTMLAIVATANQFTAPILEKYPTAETSGWSLKQAESEAIIAAADASSSIPDALAQTMIMKALTSGNGWNDAEVVAAARAVVAKAKQFAGISAMVEIMREQSVTAVEAANNLAELEATKTQLMEAVTALAVKYGLA